jgi:hypothetical protein
MPCVILTHGMADTLLAPNIKDQVKIKYVGQFDGNRGRKRVSLTSKSILGIFLS